MECGFNWKEWMRQNKLLVDLLVKWTLLFHTQSVTEGNISIFFILKKEECYGILDTVNLSKKYFSA